MFRLTLKLKLAVILAAIMLASFGLVYLATSSLATSILADQETRSLQAVADILLSALAHSHDRAELDESLHLAERSAGLVTAQVLTEGLETVAPGGSTPAEILIGRDALLDLGRSPGGNAIVRSPSAGKLFVSLRPLPGGGRLFVARTTAAFEDRRHSMTVLLVIWGAVVVLAVLLGGSILLRHVVVRPIDRLLQEASRVATGDPAMTALPGNSDEFGALRGSLNSMADRIRADRTRIEKHVEELTEINRRLSEAHEQIIRTEKLASVGQLAAGVAHEIGNPIGVILGYAEMLEDSSLDEPARKSAAGHIRRATERIQGTIRDLLDFSRPAIDEAATSDVLRETRDIVQFVSPQPRFRYVKIDVVQAAAQSRRAAIPPSRFKQVLLNLLFNAADAMDGRGAVTLTVEEAGEGVRVALADSGPGIPESILLKIFDPFFTTKDVGKGTGLGLYVCHTIMNRYGGSIEVANRAEGGAQFTLFFPGGVQ